ncbi:hypothetical protein ANCCEY_03672 [Ancylostoma ceylanicum]|uniref:DUF7083 domain-containing protein n=1 Tax=Ancylostoma ceylanicum TaxID=53326 RepID=A0A0D6MAV8_9BILA|nr:hypothetical protein ANCCEY_03672 [Ancylostoma ceylanicum]
MISEEQFQRLLAALTHSTPATDPAINFDTLARRIVQFCYDPGADITFEAWYRRHADIFTVDAKSLDEATRVRLLLHKLDAPSYEKYPTVPDKSLDINTTMERQFNRKHGARRRSFKVGDPVLVKTYQGQQRWTNGQVLRRLGLVLYEVLVGKEKWIRHTNQLRIRFGEGDHNATDDMDTLFEMFDLKRPQSPIHSSTSLTYNAKESTTLTAQNVPQLRRSTRTRRAPRRLVIDPVQKSYRTRGTNS